MAFRSWAKNAAIAVVSGTTETSAVAPIKLAAISGPRASLVRTSDTDWPVTENNSSSGKAEPAYARTSEYTVDAM
jgi:hypothetical protein